MNKEEEKTMRDAVDNAYMYLYDIRELFTVIDVVSKEEEISRHRVTALMSDMIKVLRDKAEKCLGEIDELLPVTDKDVY